MSEIIEILMNEARLCDKNSNFHGRFVDDIMLHVKFTDGHIHSIYPKKNIAKELTISAMEDLQIESVKETKIELPKRIIFHNRQAIGDILMMTCSIRDFKRVFPNIQIKVETTAMHIWDYNPNICQEKWNDVIDGKENTEQNIKLAINENKPIKLYIGPSKGTNASNRSDKHFANAYRMSIEDVLNVKIPQGLIRPDIYMTEEEYKKDAIIKQPYWLIIAGEKGDWTCKTFPFQKWQEVVEKLPNIIFVQLGSSGHKHPELKEKNVINYIGKTQDRNTGIRDLFNLFLNCEGSIGLVSFQMHLAAAFNKPCVVMAGAREPVWFTRYPGQRYMASDGCLSCTVKNNDEPTACWFCKLERCSQKRIYTEQEVPRCSDVFSSDEVVNEIKRYYDGGRLFWDKISGKSKLVNVVKDSIIKIEKKKEENKKSKYGIEFGGGSITDRDWKFIQEIIEKYKINTVLEFGAGLSTLLLNSILGRKVITYETNINWIKQIKELNEDCDIRRWDGIVFKDNFKKQFDLAFVDGPAGGENREESIKTASKFAKIVIIHDAGRVPERKWQDKYLKDKFHFESKGGHRCHLWKRTIEVKDNVYEKWYEEDPTLDIISNTRSKVIENKDIKSIKEKKNSCQIKNEQRILRVLFNGRGEGGAERSTTWIMNRFIRLGWRVQYFSPKNTPSGTFRKEGDEEIEFIDGDGLKEKCDILFLYTNDWVWDFKLSEIRNLINSIEAKRKVMAVNYRLGDIGTQKALWTIGWDKYIFLNSSLENALLNRIPKSNTKILPPPTDLSKFFASKINYSGNLKLIRHSSQGDAKYPKNFNEIVERILYHIPGSEIFLMPAPSFLSDRLKASDRVHTFKRNQPSVREFLTYGNVFWYKLPEGYHDQGPKVIMEAMASGLPVIADNHSGAKDRVVRGTGFLCDNIEQHINFMKELILSKNKKLMGEKAKLYAEENYNPENWIKEIIK